MNDPSWSIKAVLNSSEGGSWVRKGSSFRFRGPFCKWRGLIVIVSAPTYKEHFVLSTIQLIDSMKAKTQTISNNLFCAKVDLRKHDNSKHM